MTIKPSTKQALAMVATAVITACATCVATRSKTEASSPNTATSTAASSPTTTATASPTQSQSFSFTLPPNPAVPSQQKSDRGGISVGGDNNGQINGEGSHDNTFIGRLPPRDLSHPKSRSDLLDLVPTGEKFRIERVSDAESGHFAKDVKDFLVSNGRVFDTEIIAFDATWMAVNVFSKQQVKDGRNGDYYLIRIGADDGKRGPSPPSASQ